MKGTVQVELSLLSPFSLNSYFKKQVRWPNEFGGRRMVLHVGELVERYSHKRDILFFVL